MSHPYQSPGRQLMAAVQRAAAHTPYTVVPTERGFDLVVDLPRWGRLMAEHRVKHTFIHQVTLEEASRRMTITQREHQILWRASSPAVGREVRRSAGRMRRVSFGTRVGGGHGPRDAFRFDSEEGYRIISRTAEAMGWSRRTSTQAKFGVVFAIIGGVGALLAAVAVLLIA